MMEKTEADLIVIGAGLTGLVAAQTAVGAGMQVKILAKGLGALHWGPGTVDLLGYYPDDGAAVRRPFETIRALTSERPNHPYAIVGEASLHDALTGFVLLSQDIGLPYGGAAREGDNLWLPSPVGAARPTFLAPQAQLAGDLARKEPMLIVGFSGMRDFFPDLIADNLAKQGREARAAFLPVSVITDRRDINNVRLAEALDDPRRRSDLAGALKRLVRRGERIGLPAVLGIEVHARAFAELQDSLAVPIFEIPTLPSSVPGMRLSTALRGHLAKAGVRVEVNAEIVGFNAKDEHVEFVETATSGRPLKHHADRFLLATGGILGGGIESDHTGRIWEPVMNLPLATPQQRAGWFKTRFFDPCGHPIFRAGVTVENHFQPVDGDTATVYRNVWAAGCLLAHSDPILERSHEGVAIGTGTAAARFAAT